MAIGTEAEAYTQGDGRGEEARGGAEARYRQGDE
jgi:hypothetical protein